MRVDKTVWPMSPTTVLAGDLLDLEDDMLEQQPGFGIELRWNDPVAWWKPFLAVRFWWWLLQIGWLVE